MAGSASGPSRWCGTPADASSPGSIVDRLEVGDRGRYVTFLIRCEIHPSRRCAAGHLSDALANASCCRTVEESGAEPARRRQASRLWLDRGVQPSFQRGTRQIARHVSAISARSSGHARSNRTVALTPVMHLLFHCPFGRRLLQRRTPRPTSGQARPRRRSCRASSTICTAGSADSPLESPPTPPDARGLLNQDSSTCSPSLHRRGC